MEIRRVESDKWAYLPLLLVGDEQESMIARYLDRGTLLALDDGGLRAVCVVTAEGPGVFEIKNLAVEPAFHRRGYGRAMVERAVRDCRAAGGRRLLVGTGDSPLTLPFYHACGFRESHRVPDFFLRHYDHPIYEGGRLLTDMVYLSMNL